MIPGELWNNNEIQFARLLCELEAAVDISEDDWDLACASMDLERNDLGELMARARKVFAEVKEALK